MSTVVAISLLVPAAAGVALLSARGRLPRTAADIRGIALQTVIIIVVLLAIAGAVAGVLLTRGGQAVDQLEDTELPTRANITNSALCRAAGGTWNTAAPGSCT